MLDIMQRMKLYKELNPNELTPQQFSNIEKEIIRPDKNLISDEYFDFKLWCLGQPSRQEFFAKFISKKLKRIQATKVLEVGCGYTGRLSRILAKEGFIMTAIDPKIKLESSDNVKFIKGKFDYREFNLNDFDYVIAQEPCDATEHVVRACVNQHIPFTISLCGVLHKLISGEQPEDVYKWYEYLENIDKNICFRYAQISPLFDTPILKSNF